MVGETVLDRIGGLLPTNGEFVFSNIADAAITDEAIWILDDVMLRLHRLDRLDGDGRRSSHAGGELSETQFVSPVEFELDPKDPTVVYVLDSEAPAIHWLRYEGAFESVGVTPLPTGIRSFCVLDDNFYILAPRDSIPIQGLSRDGTVIAEWRIPEYTGRADFDGATTSTPWHFGTVVCEPQSGTVLFVSTFFGQVFAFGPTGQSRWSLQLEGLTLRNWEFTAQSNGGVGFRSYPNQFSGVSQRVEAAAIVRPGILGLTIITERPDQRLTGPREARLVSVDAGTEFVRRRTGVVLVGVGVDSMWYGFSNRRIPQFLSITYQ